MGFDLIVEFEGQYVEVCEVQYSQQWCKDGEDVQCEVVCVFGGVDDWIVEVCCGGGGDGV